MHFHCPGRGETSPALGTRQPGALDGSGVAAVGVGVELAAVGEHLRAERAPDVGLGRINFAALLCRRRLVEQTSLLMNLKPRGVDEQLWAVVARHPVGLNQLFSMTLVDVELEVVVVQEGHGTVRTNNFFLLPLFRRSRVRVPSVSLIVIVRVIAGAFCKVAFRPSW